MNAVLKINHEWNLLTNLSKNDLMISAIQDNYGDTEVVSKYIDNVWSFKGKTLNNKVGNKNSIIHFDKFIFQNGELLVNHNEILNILKDCGFKMLSQGLKVSTICKKTKDLFVFLDYMYSTYNIKNPSEMKEEQVNNYVDYLFEIYKNKTTGYIQQLTGCVDSTLFKYRKEINNGINFKPFEGVNLKRKAKITNKSIETNQTNIIPDFLWKNISATCEKQIDDYLFNIENENEIQDLYIESVYSKKGNKRFSKPYSINKNKNILKRFNNSKEHKEYLSDTKIAAGIIIQAYTGMRISELYSIQLNCIFSENVSFKEQEYDILKIKGSTFKYKGATEITNQEGKETTWLCPKIVCKAVKALTLMNNHHNNVINYFTKSGEVDSYKKEREFLFINTNTAILDSKPLLSDVSREYKTFLNKNGVEFDFKLTSHCFRRTLARYFARTMIDIPVENLKEQFKHYSSNITEYYMKEDETADSAFIELMEGYSEAKNNKETDKQFLLFEKMKDTFNSAIMTANNVDELLAISSGKQVKVVNEYLIQLDNEKPLNPLESLTCEGIIVLPNIHKKYWQEMLVLYDELIILEPNSIWYKKEKVLIENVMNKLNKNEAYIAGEAKCLK